jgi:uncharacterized protein DUF1176
LKRHEYSLAQPEGAGLNNRFLCSACFSVLVSGLASGSASAELTKTSYADWTVHCNDKNYCIAETSTKGSNGEAFRLKIERGDKAGSEVYVTYRPKTALEVGTRARIEIEGKEDNYGFFGLADKIYTGNEMTFGGPADRDLLANLRLGQKAAIQIEFGGSAGTLTYLVSLKGMVHALLKMDEQQDRIGRLDAIVAWGGVPAGEEIDISAKSAPPTPSSSAAQSDVAAASASGEETSASRAEPPPAPRAEARDTNDPTSNLVYSLNDIPDSIQMMGYRVLDCQLDEAVPAFGAQYFAAGDVETWIVPCQMADANVPYYMATHIPFNPSLDEWQEFETPPDFNQPNHALVNNLFYDQDTEQVTGTTYFSPNYDCGTFERHEIEAESGKYTLMEYLEKTNCDGVTGPAEGWPLKWTIDEMGG